MEVNIEVTEITVNAEIQETVITCEVTFGNISVVDVPIESISVNGVDVPIEYKNVDIAIPTKTSDLVNDGADGVHPFITAEDIPSIDPNTVIDAGYATDKERLKDTSGENTGDETPSTIGALIETTELETITDTTKIAGSVGGVVNWFSGLRIKEYLTGFFAKKSNAIDDINLIYDYRDRVIADGGTFEGGFFTKPLFGILSTLKLALYPSAFKTSKIYGMKNNDFSFIRNSVATRINEKGLIEVMPAHAPRIDYSTGAPKLLIEGSDTNLIEYSEDFSNSYWTKDKSLLTPNIAISPRGDLTASLIIGAIGYGIYLAHTFTVVDGNYIITYFVKDNGYSRFATHILGRNTTVGSPEVAYTVDLILGTITSSNTYFGFGKIYKVGNGWFKVEISYEKINGTSTDLEVRVIGVSTSYAIPSDGIKGLYLWGVDVKKATKASSYIQTNGAIGTRLADNATVTVPSGVIEIIEKIEGVEKSISTIPTTYTIPIGNVDKIEMK